MIVATLPEPTVRPPSRYLNSVFCGIFYTFYCGKQRKIVVFAWRIFICMISWHQNDFLLIYSYYMVLAPCINNINRENINSFSSTTLINKWEFIYVVDIQASNQSILLSALLYPIEFQYFPHLRLNAS